MGKLALTLGFGAAVTGLFTLGSALITERQKTAEQRCSVAQQIVIDESPSPALNEQQRLRLGLLAMRTLEKCLGDEA